MERGNDDIQIRDEGGDKMSKKEKFLEDLLLELCALPLDEKETEERLSFYREMIEDRIESGLSEEEAVAEVGSVDEIIASILKEIPLTTLVKKKIRPKRKISWWEITLIVLGSPIWIAILASLFAVVVSAYAVIWTLVAVAWAVFAAFAACTPAAIVMTVLYFCEGLAAHGIAFIGISLFAGGVAILLFLASKATTVGIARLTKNIALWIKRLFVKRGADRK